MQAGTWCGLTFGLLLFSTGCATIISGAHQDIEVTSSPNGAQVKVERLKSGTQRSTVWQGSTPATIGLKRKYPYVVTLSQEGYESVEIEIDRGTNGWVFGNILFVPLGALIGAGIDFGTGAARKLKPGAISVELEAISTTSSAESVPGPPSIYAVLRVLPDTDSGSPTND